VEIDLLKSKLDNNASWTIYSSFVQSVIHARGGVAATPGEGLLPR
jgi:hypothetical protein